MELHQLVEQLGDRLELYRTSSGINAFSYWMKLDEIWRRLEQGSGWLVEPADSAPANQRLGVKISYGDLPNKYCSTLQELLFEAIPDAFGWSFTTIYHLEKFAFVDLWDDGYWHWESAGYYRDFGKANIAADKLKGSLKSREKCQVTTILCATNETTWYQVINTRTGPFYSPDEGILITCDGSTAKELAIKFLD